jgi:hypothetical protein
MKGLFCVLTFRFPGEGGLDNQKFNREISKNLLIKYYSIQESNSDSPEGFVLR